jgi:MFS family permease
MPMTTAPAPPGWVRWLIVGLLVAYSFTTWFNRVSMSVAYDERIKAQYGISPAQMGWVYSAFLFAYMLCMTPGGWLIDRYGPWLALVVMGFGSAFFGALTGGAVLATGGAIAVLALFFAIRSLMGALTAPVYPASSRVVSHWLPMTQRAGANGMIQGAAAVGIACTFPFFGALIDWVDWPNAFLISGAVTALLALAWTVCGANAPSQQHWPRGRGSHCVGAPPSDLVPSPEDAQTGIMAVRRAPLPIRLDQPVNRALWRHRSLMLLTVAYGCIGYVEYLFFFWMHHYFEDVLDLGTANSRTYAAILTLAMAVGMVVGGWIADRLHRLGDGRRYHAIVPVTGMCAGAVLLVLGILAHDVPWIVTLLALALAAVGATEAPVWTLATELGGRRGATAAAICNTGGNAGGLIAPIVTPWVSGLISRQAGLDETTGWQLGISVGSVVAISGAVLWLWIQPTPVEESP